MELAAFEAQFFDINGVSSYNIEWKRYSLLGFLIMDSSKRWMEWGTS